MHRFPQVPQLTGSASRDRHVPPHACVSAGHWQVPPTQVLPAVQPWPHAPQFDGSLARRTHASPHAVCPGAGHAQTPPRHACAGPQLVEQDPQWRGSEVVSTQAAPHASSPDAHEALSQLAASVQIPPHRTWPAEQAPASPDDGPTHTSLTQVVPKGHSALVRQFQSADRPQLVMRTTSAAQMSARTRSHRLTPTQLPRKPRS